MSWVATAIVGSAVIGGISANRASKRQAGALDAQNEIAYEQLAMAREQWDYYKTNYRPLEEGIVSQALEAGSPEEQEAAAGRAVADVRQQYGISRGTTERGIQRYGLNPADPAYQAMMADSNLTEAAAAAGAANRARTTERDTGYTKQIQALSLGKGLPTDASANLSRASAGFGNVASGQSAIYDRTLNNTYNMTSALSQMPWGKIFNTGTDVIGDRAASGQLGPPNASSGIVERDFTNQYSEGGVVRGPGTGKSDSIPIRASKGEYVIPAAVVRAKGIDFFDDLIDKFEVKQSRRLGRGNNGN